MRYLTPLVAGVGVAAAILAAPAAVADPADSNLQCNSVGDSDQSTGTQSTTCSTPGNVQITATAPDVQPDFVYPYDDLYYGPALVFGGGDGPSRGGGGGGVGGRR